MSVSPTVLSVPLDYCDYISGLDAAVENPDLVTRGTDVGQHQDVFVRHTPSGIRYVDVSANGTRTYSAWVPSILCPRIQPPPPMQRP